jgi:hypothetical protein
VTVPLQAAFLRGSASSHAMALCCCILHLAHRLLAVGDPALSTHRRWSTNSLIPPVAWGAWASPRCYGASSGCSRWRHSVQYTLAGARATALEQPSCWQRLPPPCAWQCCVPPVAAALGQPACWHRHARNSAPCRRERTWCSPSSGSACRRHARCSGCRLEPT